MALVEVKGPKKLAVDDFIKLKLSDHLLPRSFTRLKTVSICDTNIVKLSGKGSTVNVDILKGLQLDRVYNYVSLRGVVISGEWMVPEGCNGGAVVSLMDKRMKGFKAGLVAEFKTRATSRQFQFKFVPNYSLCIDDAVKKPWELFFKLVGVPIEDGYFPLAVEIAVMVEQSKSIINHGLRTTILHRASGDVNGLDLQLPSAEIEDTLDLISNISSYNRFPNSHNNRINAIKGHKNQKEKRKFENKNLHKFLSEDSETNVSDGDIVGVGLNGDNNEFPELNSDGDL